MTRKTTSASGTRGRAARETDRPTRAADRIAALDPEDLTETERCSLLDLALRVLAERHRRGRMLAARGHPGLPAPGSRRVQERVFGCLFLDNRHRILGLEELFQGTVDGASVHPRVVVQRALALMLARSCCSTTTLMLISGCQPGHLLPLDGQSRLETRLGLMLRRSSASSRSRRPNSARVSCQARSSDRPVPRVWPPGAAGPRPRRAAVANPGFAGPGSRGRCC